VVANPAKDQPTIPREVVHMTQQQTQGERKEGNRVRPSVLNKNQTLKLGAKGGWSILIARETDNIGL